MQKMKNPAGRRGFGKGIVEHFQGREQCSTEWDECQRAYRVMAAGVVIVWIIGVLI